MIKKLDLAFWPAEHMEALVFLHHLLILEEDLEGLWPQVERDSGRLLERTHDETRIIVEMIHRLGEAGVDVTPRQSETLCVALGLPAVQLGIDLPGLLDAGRPAVMDLLQVARWLRVAGAYEHRVKVGGRVSDIRELMDEVKRQASSRGHALGGARPRAGAPSQCRIRWDDVTLGADARIFLSVNGLRWPVDARRLRKAYRRCAFEHHPDRNRGDPGAVERFLSLGRGYQELRDLL